MRDGKLLGGLMFTCRGALAVCTDDEDYLQYFVYSVQSWLAIANYLEIDGILSGTKSLLTFIF